MAYTKVYAVHSRLDKKVNYALNEDKTRLSGMLDYALNPGKTQGERRIFGTALNCNLETAFEEMRATQRRYRKEGGVVGYHFIQSFAPGEVSPEEAHAIGVGFARRCFGDRFEVVVGTHLDRHHLHNHVVVNAVSWADGLKYHSSPESYFSGIRGTSDALCREHGLSVIETDVGGKHYAEWKAEQEGKPTVRGQIRADLEEVMRQSLNYATFLDLLRRQGYTVKAGPNVKHTTARPPWASRPVRLDGLGEGYTEADIKAQLQDARWGFTRPAPPARTIQAYRFRGQLRKARKLHGFRALYFRYLYLLGKVKKRSAAPSVRRALTADLVRFDRYVAQHRFLADKRIDTAAQLTMYQEAAEARMEALAKRRQGLYSCRKEARNEREQEALSVEIGSITTELRSLRRERTMCHRIEADAAQVPERLRQAKAPQPRTILTHPGKRKELPNEQSHFQQRPPGH